MPPEPAEPAIDAETLAPWKARAAAIWVGLVTLGYLGTIAMERGERIRRIVSAFVSE